MLTSTNIRLDTLAQVATPGMTVQLVDSWLDESPATGIYTAANVHELCLLETDHRRLRQQTGFANIQKYVPLRSRLMYSPAECQRHTYFQESLDESQLPLKNRSVNCYFDPAFFDHWTRLGDPWDSDHLKACLTIDRPLLMTLMEELFREMTAPGFSNDLFVHSVGPLLLIEIARHFKSLPKPEAFSGRKHLAKRHLDRVCQYIEESDGRTVTAEALAELCNLSVNYLRHAFKDTMGQSLGTYVAQVRIARAKTLLSEGRLTLKQIAHQSGFANPNSFCVAFRRETGETPTSYQRRQRS